MPVSSTDKDEKIVYLVMRIIVLLVVAAYVLFGLVWRQPCDIDKQYLSCRVTGSIADWLGSIMFIGGCLSLSGVLNWVYKVKGNVSMAIIGVVTVAGILMVWFL